MRTTVFPLRAVRRTASPRMRPAAAHGRPNGAWNVAGTRFVKGRSMKNETVIGGITVGGQPSAEELTAGRFATVVNIRGDAEEGNITGSALEGSDVDYVHVPWTIDTVTNADVARIREAVDAAEGPVLIH